MKIYIFILSLVTIISSVISFREDLLLASNVKSWITDHNFTEIINLSFSFSKCCNVLLSGQLVKSNSKIVFFFFEFLGEFFFSQKLTYRNFYSDSTEDSEIFFDRFRTIYPYDYFLKRNTNEYEQECNGYLLLGSYDDEIMEFVRK